MAYLMKQNYSCIKCLHKTHNLSPNYLTDGYNDMSVIWHTRYSSTPSKDV